MCGVMTVATTAGLAKQAQTSASDQRLQKAGEPVFERTLGLSAASFQNTTISTRDQHYSTASKCLCMFDLQHGQAATETVRVLAGQVPSCTNEALRY